MNEYPLMQQAIEVLIRKADNELENNLSNEGYLKPKKTVEHINSTSDRLADILQNQCNDLISGIKDKDVQTANIHLSTLLETDHVDELISSLFSDGFSDLMQEIAGAYIQRIDTELSLAVFSKRTTDWIQEWSIQLGKVMKLTSHAKIQSIFADALESGKSTQAVSDSLMDAYEFSPMRARATAVTEMLTAHRAAAQEAYTQIPAVEFKAWRHTGSHKNIPRANHQAMDGKQVKKNERYELIGENGNTYHPMYPGDTDLPPAERVHCHCISQPIVSSDVLGLTIEERKVLQQQAIDNDNAAWEKELDAKNKDKAGISIS